MKMKRWGFLVLLISLNFGALNDKHYEGLKSEWKNKKSHQDRLKFISLFLPPNPTVFEAGANEGLDSVLIACTWPKGKIISFEPLPNRFTEYQERAKKFSNMFGYNLAVNTYNGFAEFYVCWGSDGKNPVFEGASSLLEASESMKENYKGPKIQVPCVILDDWCQKNSITTIDFMWLDLEGFELQFLKSSPEILKTVKVIYTETNFYLFRKEMTLFTALNHFLTTQGFKMVAHWYNEGIQGNAIYVREELIKNDL